MKKEDYLLLLENVSYLEKLLKSHILNGNTLTEWEIERSQETFSNIHELLQTITIE